MEIGTDLRHTWRSAVPLGLGQSRTRPPALKRRASIGLSLRDSEATLHGLTGQVWLRDTDETGASLLP